MYIHILHTLCRVQDNLEGRKEEMDTQMEPQGVGPSLGMQFLFSEGLRVSGMREKMETFLNDGFYMACYRDPFLHSLLTIT